MPSARSRFVHAVIEQRVEDDGAVIVGDRHLAVSLAPGAKKNGPADGAPLGRRPSGYRGGERVNARFAREGGDAAGPLPRGRTVPGEPRRLHAGEVRAHGVRARGVKAPTGVTIPPEPGFLNPCRLTDPASTTRAGSDSSEGAAAGTFSVRSGSYPGRRHRRLGPQPGRQLAGGGSETHGNGGAGSSRISCRTGSAVRHATRFDP